MKPDHNQTLRGIRSYVLRTGRITESQKRAFNQHWEAFGLSVADGIFDQEKIFGRTAPLVVEIGFGMGESLLTMAEQAEDSNFLGIEVHSPGVGRLMNKLVAANINNVRIYKEDALLVLEHCLADESLDRLQLYFPDPWPKKKHHKRRIVQSDFIRLVWRKLKPNAVFHLATDWQPYAEYMVEVFAEQPALFNNLAGPDQFSPRPTYRPLTKFEQRGQRLGHGVWDLLFEKVI